jgi:hypothetical protein
LKFKNKKTTAIKVPIKVNIRNAAITPNKIDNRTNGGNLIN